MSCTSPRTVGFKADGKTISWSQKDYSKEYSPFQLPCGKCIECRLSYARQWAIRCVHEAKMHENNCFITLTYSDENLKSKKLIYEDFQLFMKKLRKLQNEPMGMFVVGEYGEQFKRPHWHAIIFNWAPKDGVRSHKNQRGDQLYESETLTTLWGNGKCDYGAVTMESAGYCARYSAKKLVHGPDGVHEYEPISKKSSKHAIGKKWLEKYYKDIFVHGVLHINMKGQQAPIPRYYEKWFKENHPEEYLCYITETKRIRLEEAQKRADQEELEYAMDVESRRHTGHALLPPKKKREIRKIIQNQKFKQLQAYLKL